MSNKHEMSLSHVQTITGLNSEQIVADLLINYAPRDLVNFHRAVMMGDKNTVLALVHHDRERFINSTLLPVETFGEVSKCTEMNHEDLLRFHSITKQVIEDYPVISQHITGQDGEFNEMFPLGAINKPENNLDSLYFTPLLRACQTEHFEMVHLLLKHGADRDYHTPCQNNAIYAVLHSDLEEPEEIAKIIKELTTDSNKNHPSYVYAVLASKCPQPLVLQTMLDLGYPIHPDIKMDLTSVQGWVDSTLIDVLVTHI